MAAPEYVRTRHEALDRLARLIADEIDEGRRVMVGFDFPFGYPKGVAEHLTGRASGLSLWDWLAERIEDAPDNANNRYDVAAAINAAYPGLGPFWGRPTSWRFPTIPVRASERTQSRRCTRRSVASATYAPPAPRPFGNSPMPAQSARRCYWACPCSSAWWQDPLVNGHAAIWPFETGLRTPDAQAVIAEVYPGGSLLRDEVRARRREDEILDCAQVRVNAEAFARLDARGGLAPLFAGAPCLTPEERRIVETEEGWILSASAMRTLRRVH